LQLDVLKKVEGSIVELKRMFVAANARKFGFTMIITELEQATELHIVVLETLFKQIEDRFI
jgi:hypothetical protein